MNILTHPVHTGYQFDLAKTGHEFYSLETPGSGEIFWDLKSRPQPGNYHHLKRLQDAPVNFDLILVHYDLGYHSLKQLNLPLIFKEHCLRAPFKVPADWLDRITCYSFASRVATERWIMPSGCASRKAIIGMGMDVPTGIRRNGRDGGILVVGQNIRARGNEKGYDNLMQLSERFRITVVGRGSEGIPGGVGPAADYSELLRYYRTKRVFLNPSNLLGMSTLEAMAAGMPVVSFRMLNSDVVRDGVNGLIVDTVEQAEIALRSLLRNPAMGRVLGKNAQATIRQRFRADLFVERWNTLFRRAVYEYRPGAAFAAWKPFDIASKPAKERSAAEHITGRAFVYCRVGFDERRMTFSPDGRVGEGAAGCEVFWDVKAARGSQIFLELSSGCEITCRLRREPDGTWRGRWIHHEKMPIVLSPVRMGADRASTRQSD
jgi:glycosyltransferase involved in cell wall biosynthesis